MSKYEKHTNCMNWNNHFPYTEFFYFAFLIYKFLHICFSDEKKICYTMLSAQRNVSNNVPQYNTLFLMN